MDSQLKAFGAAAVIAVVAFAVLWVSGREPVRPDEGPTPAADPGALAEQQLTGEPAHALAREEPADAPTTAGPAELAAKSQPSARPAGRSNLMISMLGSEMVDNGSGTRVAPTLYLRCQRNRTDVYVGVGMQVRTSAGHSNVRIGFDEAPAEIERWRASTDGEALFAPRPIPLIRRMLDHRTMSFEFVPAGSSDQSTDFDLSGLAEPLDEFRAACHWR